ncbi:hypothetical protein ABZ858_00095 [Streptomyces sp. NPDC047017]|uniref:hypothetical protein n=1 Tax=Streptomyces sp. NPDC047017 TaxID=3155024 RepID=UPI0033F2C3AE
MGIELERVMARLAESGGREAVSLDEETALEALGALSIVDPKRVGGINERLVGACTG